MGQALKTGIRVGGRFDFACYGKDGKLKWTDSTHNLVTTEGQQHILDVLFTGTGESQVDPWYVGLADGSMTPAAGDVMNSHVGWTEFTEYDEATRQAYVDVRSSQTVSNTASKASFTVNAAGGGFGGGFLASDNTRGGTTGILLCAAALAADRTVASGDTIEVTYTFTAADDGT